MRTHAPMDLQVAVFLLIFLSISSLATLGICFIELRSCWRNHVLKKTRKRDELVCLEAARAANSAALAAAASDGPAARARAQRHLTTAREIEEIMAAVDETGLDLVFSESGNADECLNLEEKIARENQSILYGEYPSIAGGAGGATSLDGGMLDLGAPL